MNATAPAISYAKLAGIYGVSRQRLHQLAQRHGKDILLRPDLLAQKFEVTRCPMSSALNNCISRQRIAAKLKELQA